MATIYEKDLMPPLAREVGDVDNSNIYYGADQLFSAINDGLNDFNNQVPDQQYSVIGSGNSAYFSPDPSIEDKRLIVLFAALCLMRGDFLKAARSAIIHSNPAGKTDMSRIPDALGKQIDRVQNKIDELLDKRSRQLTEEESIGKELKSTPTSDTEAIL